MSDGIKTWGDARSELPYRIVDLVLNAAVMYRMPQKEAETPEYRLILAPDGGDTIKAIRKMIKEAPLEPLERKKHVLATILATNEPPEDASGGEVHQLIELGFVFQDEDAPGFFHVTSLGELEIGFEPDKDEVHVFRPDRDDAGCGTTNLDRAMRARAALDAYIDTDKPDITHLQDLLGDLMHLADMERAEREDTFEQALHYARGNYMEER